MQRPVPDPEQPDINSVRALRTQTVRRGNHVVANGPAVAVRVDGDDLSVVVCFDLVPDVALLDVVAQAGNLIPRAGWRSEAGWLRGRRHLRVPHIPPFKGVLLRPAFYHFARVRDNEERPHTGTQAPKRNKGRIH